MVTLHFVMMVCDIVLCVSLCLELGTCARSSSTQAPTMPIGGDSIAAPVLDSADGECEWKEACGGWAAV